MRLKIILLLLSITLFNCDQFIDVATHIHFGRELYDFGIQKSEINTPIKVHLKIKELGVIYKKDVIDNWSDPYDTVVRGYGDCDDLSVLFLNLYYYGTGKKGEIVFVDVSRSIVSGGIPKHVAVMIDGVVYEPQTGLQVDYGMQYYYSFDEVFSNHQ